MEGGYEAWQKDGREIDTIETISAEVFESKFDKSSVRILDVRKPGEYSAEHIEDAQSFPLDYINKNMSDINKDTLYYMHCRSGYRSTVAASILKARGFERLINVQDLFDKISASSVPTTDFVCSSTKA